MQFSLRRMLLAVAAFAATLGTLTFHAKRLGMFRLETAPTWWAAAIVTAFGAGTLTLLGHRRDLVRIGNVIVWIVMGLLVGAMLSANNPPEFAIPGGLIGGLIRCILPRRPAPQPPPPSR